MSKSNRSNYKLDTDLLSLRALLVVVELGGFSAAAKRLNRSQSAISLQIARLEERLHTRLLNRTSRSVALTAAGEIFVSYARRIVELGDEALLAVTSPDESTLLRVGFAEYLAPQHLHHLLARFRRAHPNCDLSLVLGTGPFMFEAMQRGELDLIFAGPDAENGRLLWEEPLVWSGTNANALNSSDPIELVLLHPPCSYRQIAFDALTDADISWKVSIDANSIQAIQSAIRAGLGASVLPLSAIRDDMALLQTDLPPLPNTSVMSFVNSNTNNIYAERFTDFLLAGITDNIAQRKFVYSKS